MAEQVWGRRSSRGLFRCRLLGRVTGLGQEVSSRGLGQEVSSRGLFGCRLLERVTEGLGFRV
jgi:hypothetical protein